MKGAVMPDRIMDCPECGKAYNIATFKPGMKFRCTECGAIVTVPGGEPDYGDAPKRARRPSRRRSSSRDAEYDEPRRRRSPARRRRSDRYDDEEDGRDRRGASKFHKKDNTMIIAIAGAIGLMILIGVVLAVTGTTAFSPSQPPPEALGTESECAPRTANYSKYAATPNPFGKNPSGTPPGKTNSTNNGNGNNPKVSGTAKKGKPYIELDDCSQEVKDFVANVIKKYGGEEALKQNSTWQMESVIRDALIPDRDKPDDPFAWSSETDLATSFSFKRSGTLNKMLFEQIQASRKYITCFDGKKLRKYIDKDEADVEESEVIKFANDAYDFDIIYKLSSGRFKFINEVRSRSKFTLRNTSVPCYIIRVQDRFDASILRTLYFYRKFNPKLDGFLGKIAYKDELNSQNVNKFYWNYYEKAMLKFPLYTLINRANLETKKSEEMIIFQIYKEDQNEYGKIEIGGNIPDYLFERARD